MIVALVAVVAILATALIVQTVVVVRHLDRLREERDDLVRFVVARHAGEAIALVPRRDRDTDEDADPRNPFRHHPPYPEGM